MTDIFNLYKPLRNHLRQLDLEESLSVVRAYAQYLQFGQVIPGDIQVDPEFLQGGSWIEKKFYLWELELLAREIVLNASTFARPRESLKQWPYFAQAINKVKWLENEIVKVYPKDTFLLEMYRISHRQFPWQIRPDSSWLTRYFRIFSSVELDDIIQRVVGLTTLELYTIGLSLTGIYLENFSLNLPPNISIPNITNQKFDRFNKHFSCSVDDLREKLKSSQQYNENYAYTLNPIRIHPLIMMKSGSRNKLTAPLPGLLFKRFTEGVYYAICDQPDFGRPFGEAFQSYIGDVIIRAKLNRDNTVLPEKEYYVGKERKDSIDWIIKNTDSALFIECKTKRLRAEAKTHILTSEYLEEEMGKMAEMIVQMYKTIDDYQKNRYPHFEYQEKVQVYPILVTLEDWFIFGDRIREEIESKVVHKMQMLGLSIDMLHKMPYSVCSILEFEKMAQIISRVGINKFLSKKLFDDKKRKWLYMVYMNTDFSSELSSVSDLFIKDYDRLTLGG